MLEEMHSYVCVGCVVPNKHCAELAANFSALLLTEAMGI